MYFAPSSSPAARRQVTATKLSTVSTPGTLIDLLLDFGLAAAACRCQAGADKQENVAERIVNCSGGGGAGASYGSPSTTTAADLISPGEGREGDSHQQGSSSLGLPLHPGILQGYS